ncbi:MAG: MBL fold metallo-hydrolase [Desulfobacterales bacterium]|jgi:glyoxylase-like metal-dependent hydrolase (beta-lactamase superfamily II)|nr:MBL fold metallo-hydrolase [Desulfobacterales bacterium]
MSGSIDAFDDGLALIHLTPPLEGFEQFIGAWFVPGPPAFLVDVGPASTAGQLLKALDALGVTRLDYILLSHLHLDHAGAVGRISERFPRARVVCHETGIAHLVDPARLFAGARSVLGRVADGYGPIDPVAPERLIAAQGFEAQGIRALITPGHAPHHVSFATPAGLFAGEACGVWYRFAEGVDYMRPATPPRFFLDTALRSIDALIACAPVRMAMGHLGLVADGLGLLQRHRDQLLFWEKFLARCVQASAGADILERARAGLLREDPRMAAFGRFPPPAQARENYFLGNSISGFLGWISSGRGAPPDETPAAS